MKKTIIISVVSILAVLYWALPAMAGQGRESISTGFVFGSNGTSITFSVGNRGCEPRYTGRHYRKPAVIYHNSDYRYKRDRYRHNHRDRYRHHYRDRYRHPRGHWKMKKVWVPPVYEKRWKGAHYDRRGNWVPSGRTRVMIRDGHWAFERIWISYRR